LRSKSNLRIRSTRRKEIRWTRTVVSRTQESFNPQGGEGVDTIGYEPLKIEVEDGASIWTDVRGGDGAILTFEREDEARAKLAELFPVMVQMEKYAGASARA